MVVAAPDAEAGAHVVDCEPQMALRAAVVGFVERLTHLLEACGGRCSVPGGLIDDVVAQPAERVGGVERAPSITREQAEGVVEAAGALLGGRLACAVGGLDGGPAIRLPGHGGGVALRGGSQHPGARFHRAATGQRRGAGG